MVYVASDGTIHQSPPWTFSRVTNIFYGAINFVVLFFKSLVGLENRSISFGGGKSQSKGSFWGGSGGGGGGGGGSGPRPGGGGPSKRIMTMKDINPPTIGGCPGGACGR